MILKDISNLTLSDSVTGSEEFAIDKDNKITSTQLAELGRSIIVDYDCSTPMLPNKYYYCLDGLSTINLSFESHVDNKLGEYVIRFNTGEVAPTLTYLETMKFVGGIPELKPNTSYEISIIDNLAVIGGATDE